jgi:hypothetical protein
MNADSAAARPFLTRGRSWFRDFEIGPKGLVVRKTGAHVPYSPSLAADASAWFSFFFAVKAAAPIGAPFTLACTPERARPWYLIWPVARLAGARFVTDAAKADVVMHFEDATFSANDPPAGVRAGARLINFNCRNVGKSRVAACFEEAFGYPLALDPMLHAGPAVEKSETNGAHDGRIVQCPMAPAPGRCYQRLIDAVSDDPDLVEDLRTPTIDGRPICVFIKRRSVTNRFANANSQVELAQVDEIYTPDEQARIGAFARALGLDWGGLDVLRDRREGRLYVVDANKTDMGPPIALPLSDKLRATRLLAQAFRDYVSRPADRA